MKSSSGGFALVIVSCALLATGCRHAVPSEASGVDHLARQFLATLSERDRQAFARANKPDLALFHFGAGSRVRQLYFGPAGEGRRLLCVRKDPCDIDHESMRIVERTWEIVQAGE